MGLRWRSCGKKMQKTWKVVYTKPRWEKKVNQLLKESGIASFCPLVKKERQWSDRKKIVEMPLFSSYVFVHIRDQEESEVRQTPGVINFVYYLGRPAVVREQEIDDIRHFLDLYENVEAVNIQELRTGDRVRIKNGALYGQEGKILKIEGKNVLMVLEELDSALVAKVHITQLTSDLE